MFSVDVAFAKVAFNQVGFLMITVLLIIIQNGLPDMFSLQLENFHHITCTKSYKTFEYPFYQGSNHLNAVVLKRFDGIPRWQVGI